MCSPAFRCLFGVEKRGNTRGGRIPRRIDTLSRAAEELSVSPSAVSQQIKLLEQQQTGEAMVARTKISGRHYLKFTLLNAQCQLTDVRAVIEQISHIAWQTYREIA